MTTTPTCDSSPASAFDSILSCIEGRAQKVAETYMAARSRPGGDWSDIVVRVRVRTGGLEVEWRYRYWITRSPNRKTKRRYIVRYLSRRRLLTACKDWEREETRRAREKLDELRRLYRAVRRLQTQFFRAGLFDPSEIWLADYIVGFRPNRLPARRLGGCGSDATMGDADDLP